MKTVTISEIAFTSIRGVTFWPASGKPNLLSASSDAMRSARYSMNSVAVK